MLVRICLFATLTASFLFVAVPLFDYATSFAQDSGVNLALHANSHASAADIGLPVYPGATVSKESDTDSPSADLGFILNDFHLRVLAVKYVSPDPAERILTFYRKPLSHYGQVLECDRGKAVGALTETRGGLKCDGSGDSEGHELRAGSAERYRMVAINQSQPGATRFGLVYLELPKDDGVKQ